MTTRRGAITGPVRLVVAARQNWRCSGCSKLLPSAFEVNHTVALVDGGADSNCQPPRRYKVSFVVDPNKILGPVGMRRRRVIHAMLQSNFRPRGPSESVFSDGLINPV